ncbi:MAG: apolipoprotein N-acyltransferase [Candidatus Zixiibacteriota bacterium]
MNAPELPQDVWFVRRRIEAAVLAGGLLALAYPPFPFGFLAYIAPAIVLLSVHDASPRIAARQGFVFGLVVHAATLYWIGWVTVPGAITVVVVLSGYLAVVFGVYAFLQQQYGTRAIWLFPVLWTAHEYLRTLGDLAFPWSNLSLTQVRYLGLIQFADLTGDLGVTFWVCLINVIVCRLVIHWINPRIGGGGVYVLPLVLLFTLPMLYGLETINRMQPVDHIRVAVLQGDIDSHMKWEEGFVDRSFAVYETQTRSAVRHGAELVVWPETAAPVYIRSEPEHRLRLRNLARQIDTEMLIGTLEYQALPGGGYLSYNAAIGLNADGYVSDFHAKLHLVPLGEWIPFSDRVQILRQLEVGGAHFTAGQRLVLFDHPKGQYAAAICFESVFPDIVRQLVNRGARFLVNITNDGWYGFSSGPSQHALIAVFRAIETRRPIARSANTGISVFIDRAGRMHEETMQYVPDVAVFDLGLGPVDQRTFFMKYGMFMGQFSVVFSVIVFVFALVLIRLSESSDTSASANLRGMTEQSQ